MDWSCGDTHTRCQKNSYKFEVSRLFKSTQIDVLSKKRVVEIHFEIGEPDSLHAITHFIVNRDIEFMSLLDR